jgi:hypothetical protein
MKYPSITIEDLPQAAQEYLYTFKFFHFWPSCALEHMFYIIKRDHAEEAKEIEMSLFPYIFGAAEKE